jgi:glycerol-3-phosphate dehydrogenase
VLRRTLMCFEGVVSAAGLAALAETVAPLLHWDAARVAAEVDATRKLLQERHRMTIA